MEVIPCRFQVNSRYLAARWRTRRRTCGLSALHSAANQFCALDSLRKPFHARPSPQWYCKSGNRTYVSDRRMWNGEHSESLAAFKLIVMAAVTAIVMPRVTLH